MIPPMIAPATIAAAAPLERRLRNWTSMSEDPSVTCDFNTAPFAAELNGVAESGALESKILLQ
jgi:hypothetical protein